MPKINLNIADLQAEKAELTEYLARPDAYSDPGFGSKNRRLSELDDLIVAGTRREQLEKQIMEAKELSGGGDELAELAKEEFPQLEKELDPVRGP